MAKEPTLTDYVSVIKAGIHETRLLTYCTRSFIIFFIVMQFRGIYNFKTQWRWLAQHPEVLPMLGLAIAAPSNYHCPSLQGII